MLYPRLVSEQSEQGLRDHLEKRIVSGDKAARGDLAPASLWWLRRSRAVLGLTAGSSAAAAGTRLGGPGGVGSPLVFLSDFCAEQGDVGLNLLILYIWLFIAPQDCNGLHHLCVCVCVCVRVSLCCVYIGRGKL